MGNPKEGTIDSTEKFPLPFGKGKMNPPIRTRVRGNLLKKILQPLNFIGPYRHSRRFPD